MWFLFQELVNCLLKGKTSLTFLIEPLNLKILLKPEFLLDSETIPLTICTFFLALELVTTYFSVYHRALIKGSLGCDLDGISTGYNTYVCSVMSTLCGPMDCIACQVPLSMEFSRQEYWSGSPFPSSGYLLNPGIEPRSSALQADSLPSEPPPVFRSAVIETQLLFPLSSEERENNDLLSMIIMNSRHHQGYQKYITFHRFHLVFAQVL